MTQNNKLIPSYRGAVEAWERDQMGHMNVQFYSSKASAALSHLQFHLGLSPSRIREEAKALHYRNLRIQYKAEMHVGGIMNGVSGIRAVEDGKIKAFTNLYNSVTGVLSCNQEFTLGYTDLKDGGWLETPEDVLENARNLIDAHEGEFCPPPLGHPTIQPQTYDHMFETNRSAVENWECDAFGNFETRHLVGRFSDAATHITANVGITRAMQHARNLGSAALDYYMEFHKPIRLADSLVIQSGLLNRGPKLFTFGHQLIKCDTGEIANTTTVLGCYFDKTKRKSVALPDEYQQVPEDRLLINQL